VCARACMFVCVRVCVSVCVYVCVCALTLPVTQKGLSGSTVLIRPLHATHTQIHTHIRTRTHSHTQIHTHDELKRRNMPATLLQAAGIVECTSLRVCSRCVATPAGWTRSLCRGKVYS